MQNFMLFLKMQSKLHETHSKRTFKALLWFFYTLLWVFWYKNAQIFYNISRILCWIQKTYIKNPKRTLKALLKHSYYKYHTLTFKTPLLRKMTFQDTNNLLYIQNFMLNSKIIFKTSETHFKSTFKALLLNVSHF